MKAWYQGVDDHLEPDSLAEAEQAATAALDWARDEAADEGWPEEVEDITWGLTVQQAVVTASGAGPCYCGAGIGDPCPAGLAEGPDGECERERARGYDSYAEYELRDVPDLAGSIVEVLATRPEVALGVMELLRHRVAGRWHREPGRARRRGLVGLLPPVFVYESPLLRPVGHWCWGVWADRLVASGRADTLDAAMAAADLVAVEHGIALAGGVWGHP